VFPSSFEDLQCLVGNASGSQVGKIDSVLRVELDESLLGSADAFWSRSPADDVFLLRGGSAAVVK